MSVQADTRRPSPVAEIAFEVERPQTLEAVLAFVRRYCSPEEVFSELELLDLDRFEREKLEDLEGELDSADLDLEVVGAGALLIGGLLDRARRGLLKLRAQVLELRRLCLGVPRGTEGGAS